MAYTTPLKVFRSMERVDTAEETFDNVSSGDTLTLSNEYVIDGTVTLTVDGITQSSDNFTVDFQDNSIDYSGSDSGTAEVKYRFAPFNSSTVLDRIKQVEDEIDNRLNTTFDGVNSVTDEYYDGQQASKTYVFVNRPVRSVSEVAVNNPVDDTNPNYETATEGLGEDYIKKSSLGIQFLESGDVPDARPRELQVSYKYGYDDVPGQIEHLATLMTKQDLVHGTVSGAMVDGRDNFDPQTVNVDTAEIERLVSENRIERFKGTTVLAEEGQIS